MKPTRLPGKLLQPTSHQTIRFQHRASSKCGLHTFHRRRCSITYAAASHRNSNSVGSIGDATALQRSDLLPPLIKHKVPLLHKVGALADTWPFRNFRNSVQQLRTGRGSQVTQRSSAATVLQLPTAVRNSPVFCNSIDTDGAEGKPIHPTLEVIKERALNGSLPGKRLDGYKLGLVVEGGGMRGVVTGAMLLALQVLKVSNTFDCVYGASAGAINATYYLAQQPFGLDIYTEDIANTKFLNLRRLIGPHPVMDLDFLLDHVMHNVKPLDWEAVIESPVPLKVVASSLDSLDSIVLSDFADRTDLLECLKASANVPQIAGPPREWRGHRLVDAAVFEPLPYRSALADGCTHVLVLRSRPPSQPVHPIQEGLESVLTTALKRTLLNPPYMRDAWRAELALVKASGGQLDELLAMAMEGVDPDPTGGSIPINRVLPIHPAHPDASFHPLCTDVARLTRGREAGFRAVHELLGPLLQTPGTAELLSN